MSIVGRRAMAGIARHRGPKAVVLSIVTAAKPWGRMSARHNRCALRVPLGRINRRAMSELALDIPMAAIVTAKFLLLSPNALTKSPPISHSVQTFRHVSKREVKRSTPNA